MRTFIALQLPEDFALDTAALARGLSASLEGRFLPRNNHHLTLAFLGETDGADITRAIEALDAACAESGSLSLRSDGLGKFGRTSDATLWLGIAALPEFMQLAARLREELAARNLSFDDKPFRPHITLARHVRLPKTSLPELAFPRDGEATTVTLFKSTLEREGALYKPLHTVDLGA